MSRQAQHFQCFDGIAPISDIKKCIKHGHSVLILMRGAPGCGKSHLAEELLAYRSLDDEDTRKGVVLSTDRFFYTPNGRYAFDSSRLDDFHKKNQIEARAAMENNQSPVIIDNTNMQLMHMKPYINFAIKSCYEIYVVEPATPWRHDARLLATKNKHHVDDLTIERMLSAFEPISRFADLLKPVAFVVSRVDLSDDDSETEAPPQHAAVMSPPLSLALPPLAAAVAAVGSDAGKAVPGALMLPPGLFPPSLVSGDSRSSTPPPILSMAHESLVSVQQRDVGCQATPAIGLLLEMRGEEPESVASLCCTVGESRVAQRRRGAATAHAECESVCPAPTPIATFAASFPTVPEEDVEHYVAEIPSGQYAEMLVLMGYEMDFAAPIPWQEDAVRNSRMRRGRHKEAVTGAFMDSPHSTPKKQTSIRTQKQERSGRGEGCGVTSDDHHSASASLSNAYYGYEEKMEPLAAAFTDDDEMIALDVKQPIKNILELFFGHNSRQQDVHMPMWLLRLLHRCARGDRLTKSAVYHEDFPSIDLCGLHDEEVMQQQQLRNDADLARRIEAEETNRHLRSRSSSPTDSFTPSQIASVRMLRAKYPSADPDSVAALFKEMSFNTQRTLSVLGEQFGEAAPGPAHTLPPSEIGFQSFPVLQPTPSTRSPSSNNYATSLGSGQRPAQQQMRTNLANGRITDVGRMAVANGSGMSQDEVRAEFCTLHERRAEKQKILDEMLRKAQKATGHARGYYGQECRLAKEARISVENEIAELAQWWNNNLNSDIIDLHWMLADQAMAMLRERIDQIKRGRGPKRLTVITGSGNNSLSGRPEIKTRVLAMANSQGYKHHHNNNGCIILNF